jgi:hypothetical protein
MELKSGTITNRIKDGANEVCSSFSATASA